MSLSQDVVSSADDERRPFASFVDMQHLLVELRSQDDCPDSMPSSSSSSRSTTSSGSSFLATKCEDGGVTKSNDSRCNARPDSTLRTCTPKREIVAGKHSHSRPSNLAEENTKNPFAGGFSLATKNGETDYKTTLQEVASPFKKIKFRKRGSRRALRRSPKGERGPGFIPSSKLPTRFQSVTMQVPSIFLSDSENEALSSEECDMPEDFEPT